MLPILLAAVCFILALLACRHLLDELQPGAIHQALHNLPGPALAGALLATAISYLMLLGYEWSACRHAGVRLPTRTLVLGGLSAAAIGNALGFSLLTASGVRYRLYNRDSSDILRISLFSSLALALSLPLLAAVACLASPRAAQQALGLPATWLISLALATLALYGLVLAWIRHRRQGPFLDLGHRRLKLPGVRLSALQLLLSSLDIIAAASVLYLLLPQPLPLAPFLLVYILALAAGVLSHVPGGIGVFESVMLAAFAGQLDTASLAAALLGYRLIYIVLPLLLACLALLAREARRYAPGQQALQAASGLAAPILTLLVFLAGIVLLFSGTTPSLDQRLHHLGFLVPHSLVDLSHFAASLIGILCLLLAQGLWRRLAAAWAMTLALLLIGGLCSLLKGFDWEEAAWLFITAALLAVFRHAFYRPSRLFELPFSPLTLLASLLVLSIALWLLLFSFRDVPYSHELWWQFELRADAPRALRAMVGSAILFIILALLWLLRSPLPSLTRPAGDELQRAAEVVARSQQAEGGLALSGDKTLLWHPQGDAFLMYARQGRSMVALFDPIGSPAQRAELAWAFRDLCDRQALRPVFYQVRAGNLPLYMDIGLTALKLGEEAKVDLRHFDLDSKGMKDLRYTWNRGQRDGLELRIHEPGQAPFEALQQISTAWLAGKAGREKGFSLGRFTREYLDHFSVAVIYVQGQPMAFANLLQTERHETASLDLMRMHPQAPRSTMEFLMIGLILHYQQLGFQAFSLGMVPLSGLQPRRGAPLAQRLGAVIFNRGEQFYNFKGLRRFKEKFQPTWEPRYMAVPAGLDPLVALADTAALIAGGVGALVKP